MKLAERCTVFMESDLVSYHQKGVRERISSPVSVTPLSTTTSIGWWENERSGERVMFLGGPSLNQGVVAAFENVLGRGLLVPRHREVLGAYGAAVSLQEKMRSEEKKKSTFRGLDSAIEDRMAYREKICQRRPHCHNQCKLKIYDFDGRKSVWGGECGRYEVISGEQGTEGKPFRTARGDLAEPHGRESTSR